MNNNIVFIGGIHGVGKSTICKKACDILKIKYLSASEVLMWKDINNDTTNKNVEDIEITQDRLIDGLKRVLNEANNYILDGHFCLFDSKGEINRVSIGTFLHIGPIAICNIVGDTEKISKRLSERDGKIYAAEKLAIMQAEETSYGKIVAEKLGVPYFEITNTESNILSNILLNIFKK